MGWVAIPVPSVGYLIRLIGCFLSESKLLDWMVGVKIGPLIGFFNHALWSLLFGITISEVVIFIIGIKCRIWALLVPKNFKTIAIDKYSPRPPPYWYFLRFWNIENTLIKNVCFFLVNLGQHLMPKCQIFPYLGCLQLKNLFNLISFEGEVFPSNYTVGAHTSLQLFPVHLV
jgi:hypothetical protein